MDDPICAPFPKWPVVNARQQLIPETGSEQIAETSSGMDGSLII
jgi:hypothetical protein